MFDKLYLAPELLSPLQQSLGPLEIDWSNPITDQLEHCFVMEPGGLIHDLVSTSILTPGGTWAIQANQNGYAFDSSSDGYATTGYQTIRGFDLDNPYTLFAIFTVPDNSTNNQQQCILGVETTASTRYTGLSYRTNTSVTTSRYPKFYYRQTGSSSVDLTSTITNTDPGTPMILGASKFSSTDRRLYVNGALDATATGSHSGSFTTAEISIGQARRNGGVGESTASDAIDGTVSMAMVFSRALEDIEQFSLANDPYQVIKSNFQMIMAASAPAPGGATALPFRMRR